MDAWAGPEPRSATAKRRLWRTARSGTLARSLQPEPSAHGTAEMDEA